MTQISSQDLTTTPAKAGVDLAIEVEQLSGLDLHQLRVRWRKLLRNAPPAHLSRSLLVRILSYKIQAKVLGELDRETARYLDRIAHDYARRRRTQERRQPKAPPPVPPVPISRRLKQGTLLAREFDGQMHTVTVGLDGFAWNGITYASLSEIARLITGTRWNGPRFFGLRDTRKGSNEARA